MKPRAIVGLSGITIVITVLGVLLVAAIDAPPVIDATRAGTTTSQRPAKDVPWGHDELRVHAKVREARAPIGPGLLSTGPHASSELPAPPPPSTMVPPKVNPQVIPPALATVRR